MKELNVKNLTLMALVSCCLMQIVATARHFNKPFPFSLNADRAAAAEGRLHASHSAVAQK